LSLSGAIYSLSVLMCRKAVYQSIFVLMCHEAGQSVFLHTQLYLFTNLVHILFSNVSWH